ncbi:hypothetical protein [Streptomyces werraensis]|uniref:hypothetical protein n=1 Tax=Streptomyces werraensis TaxID=68284 RepID=UPI0037D79C34
MAERFERLGWRSRSSSWYGYEVGTTWCEIEFEAIDGQDVLLNGVVAPSRFDDLAALLTRFGASYTLELYDENDNLLRETQPQARHTLDSHTQGQTPTNGRSWPSALRTARPRREG